MRRRILALSFIFSFVLGQNYSLSFDGDSYVNMGDMIDQSISFSITKGVLL